MNYDFKELVNYRKYAFFDTGATFLHLPYKLYRVFIQEFENQCKSKESWCAYYDEYKECYEWNKSQFPSLIDFLKTFPKLVFVFNKDVTYKWHPQDYLVSPVGSPNKFCLGVHKHKMFILGALFMRNYDISINQTTMQVKYRRSNCDKSTSFIDSFEDNNDDSSENDINQEDIHYHSNTGIYGLLTKILLLLTLVFVFLFICVKCLSFINNKYQRKLFEEKEIEIFVNKRATETPN